VPPPACRVSVETDKGHGRRERRTVRTTGVLTLRQRWPGLAQGLEVRRERTMKGVKAVEVAYGITSLGGIRGRTRGGWRAWCASTGGSRTACTTCAT